MDLARISQLTGLSSRRLLYVLEHHVLPGTQSASRGRRVTRDFTGFESFGIACAAWMLEAGLRRSVVAQIITALVAPQRGHGGKIPLLEVFLQQHPAVIEIGDLVNIRIVKQKDGPSAKAASWLQAGTGAVLKSYQPVVKVSIDVGEIRGKIIG
jgi:hypothetical protein